MDVLVQNRALRQAGMFLLLVLLFCSGAVSAEDSCPPVPYLVLNLAGDEDIANKAIAISENQDDLRQLLERHADPVRPPKTEDDAFFRTLKDHLEDNNGRWITRKNQKVAIYTVYDEDTQKRPDLDIKDTPRRSRLALDFETLTKLAKALGAPLPLSAAEEEEAEAKQSSIVVIRTCWQLTNVRSTLVADATADPKKPDSETTSGTAKASATITTGPVEHAFLSADLPVNSVEELKMESNGLVPKDTPSTFYVGFDYMMGDVLAEQNTLAQGLTFKALVKASSDPLDSYGVAIGLRFKSINALGFQLDTFSPFVGYIWNKNDTADGDEEYKGDWRFGISLNLDNALGWVQPNNGG